MTDDYAVHGSLGMRSGGIGGDQEVLDFFSVNHYIKGLKKWLGGTI
jgi:hypothetical protein